MRNGASILLLFILVTLPSGCGVLSKIAIPHDFSGFEEFSFELHEGLGFCPPDDSVGTASITHGENGSYTLVLSITNELENGEIELLEESARILTDDDIDRMAVVFRRVFVHPRRGGLCYFPISIDPCLTERYRWDTFEVSSYFCAQPRIGNESACDILEFLESLRTDIP